MVIGSSLDESVTIPCRVAGDPSVITFEWTFANSGERFDVTANNIGGGGGGVGNTATVDEMGVADNGVTMRHSNNQQHGPFDYSEATSNNGKVSCFQYIV